MKTANLTFREYLPKATSTAPRQQQAQQRKEKTMKGYPDNEILAILSVIAALLQFNKKKALEMFKRNFMAAETTCATISTRTTIVQQYTNSEILARLFEIAVILKFNKPKALAMFNKEFGAIYNRRNTQIDTTSLFT